MSQRRLDELPNALATMWCYLTEDRLGTEADSILRQRVLPVIHRPEAILRERLAVGAADAFIDKLIEFRDAGLQRVYIWPIDDERRQLRAVRRACQAGDRVLIRVRLPGLVVTPPQHRDSAPP